ncbi:unnamed protein product, partial [Ectocarpus fasciculatus]
SISARTAVASACRHPHPVTQAMRWDAPRLYDAPSHLYFAGDDDASGPGWICHAFHLHPLLVWPREIVGRFKTTVDDDLAQVVPLSRDEVHVVTDSDDIAAVELSEPDALKINASLPSEDRSARVAQWANTSVDTAHWDYFDRPIYLRTHD